MKRWKLALRIVAVAMVACLLCCTVAQAKKGGGGGETPPGGTVYFAHNGEIWEMGSDGANPTYVMPRLDWLNASDPSNTRHDGERWFTGCVVPDGAGQFPNGANYFEVWAASDAGGLVLLVNDLTIEVLSPTVWTRDDLSVSFIGERWLLDGNDQPIAVIEAGLYTVDVAYNGAGAVTGSVGGSLTLQADLSEQLRVDAAGFHPYEVATHSWSPDESSFTFGAASAGDVNFEEIWVVDLWLVEDPHAVPSDALLLVDSDYGVQWPQWSPDGKQIGYQSYLGTYLYNVDNGRTKRLRPKNFEHWGTTRWSPDGSHFVIQFAYGASFPYEAIYRFKADLSGKTELTADLCPRDSCSVIALGWRE